MLIDFIFSKLEADDTLFNDVFISNVLIDVRPNPQEEISILSKMLSKIECLTAQERTYYEKKVAMHRSNAERTWNNAKNKCWYLPNIQKRKAAQNAFNAIMASFGGATPMSKLVLALLSLLTNYGLDCIEEWHYIEDQLNWCQYHCEMVEFYLTVLEKG
ncbi:MAG: hypothetical protein ACSNEK_10025 [Parachlamydiaceae bacterium]